MENENLIPVNQFCLLYNVEFSFINSLTEIGLIEVTTVRDSPHLSADQINEIEKLIRMHYDLEINLEGIDVISHLLEKVNTMQQEINNLKNRVHFYEGNSENL